MKVARAKVVSAESPEVHIRRLQRMLEATKFLGSTLDLRKLTKIILKIIRHEVPVDRVTAFMIDRKSQLLRSVVAQGVKDLVIEVPIGIGISGTVVQTGEPLDVSNAQGDPRFYGGIDRLLSYQTTDIFCLPIRSRNGEVVGALELLNRARPIDEFDKSFLNDISVHIGLALELAWSHRELVEREKLERELKELRERLIQFDRVRLMGEMLGGVMHELNNPLAIVVGYVELLKVEMDARAQSSRHLGKIETAAHQASSVARKFMKFAEMPRRKRRALDLPDLLRQTISLRQYEWQMAGIRVDQHLEKTPAIIANEEELQHVFLNILKNAVEAALRSAKTPRIAVRCAQDSASGWIRVDISDNGPGITPQVQLQIFEPFCTTKRKGTGTGLGLTIARRIVEEHEGRIWFETKPASGTTFTVHLPCEGS